jgi:hypothetical protein
LKFCSSTSRSTNSRCIVEVFATTAKQPDPSSKYAAAQYTSDAATTAHQSSSSTTAAITSFFNAQ